MNRTDTPIHTLATQSFALHKGSSVTMHIKQSIVIYRLEYIHIESGYYIKISRLEDQYKKSSSQRKKIFFINNIIFTSEY